MGNTTRRTQGCPGVRHDLCRIASEVRAGVRSGSLWGFLCLAAGCVRGERGTISTVTASPAGTMATVTASPGVAILAIGGTQQLSTSATSITGAPITAFDSVTYTLDNITDSLRLLLTPAGLVTGRAVSAAAMPVDVLAYAGGVVRFDQVLVQVTATVVPGATLSIQPIAPDSAKLAIATLKTIVPVLRNATTGLAVLTPIMRYTVNPADRTRVGVYIPRFLIPNTSGGLAPSPAAGMSQIVPYTGEGAAWIYATASVYGAVLRDSVQYTFSYPYTATIVSGKTGLLVTSTFANQTVTVAPSATITFSSSIATGDPLTITYTFDNPAGATAAASPSTTGGATGNVTALASSKSSQRRFFTPGTYHWTANAAGGVAPFAGQTFSGIIVVK